MHLRNIDNDVFASKIDRSGCRIAHAALQIAPNSMNHETFNLNIQITMEIKNSTHQPPYGAYLQCKRSIALVPTEHSSASYGA